MTRADLPASADEHPATRLLHLLRPLGARLVRTRWPVAVHHADRVPEAGGVILASNHIGIIDGPLLAVFSPRPVHALTKQEMFEGRLGRFLRASGQIPLDRFHADPGAIRSCLRVVRDGGVAGIFPEGTRGDGELHRFHHGAAYLALVTGAPVVPVAFLGTRLPGGADGSVPPRGSRLAMTFGEPVDLGAKPWPRTQQDMADAASSVTDAILQTIRTAEQVTGMTLPGPLGAKREKKPEKK